MIANTRIPGAQTFPYSESDIRVNINDTSKIIAAANANVVAGGTGQGQFWSSDGGLTWSQTNLSLNTGDAFHSDPAVDWTTDGTAWAITIGFDAAQTHLRLRAFKSTDGGATWTYDAAASGAQTNTDKELMWVDKSPTSSFKDNIYVIWHNGAPVFVNRRTGPSGSWQTPVQISGAETTGTGIGADITTNSFGDVLAFWPDTGSRNLFVAKSTDGGANFGAPVTVATTFASFGIQIPSFAVRQPHILLSGGAFRTAAKDLVYVVWMDLTGATGCTAPGNAPGTSVTSACKTRIWFARSTDGGATWGTPLMINDQASKNDQFNPRMAVDATNGQIAVMYYDTVGDPGRLRSDVWMQTSDDDGVTWGPAFRVTSAQTDETGAGADTGGTFFGDQYGDYNGLTGHAGRFFPCWTDRRSGAREEIWTAAVSTGVATFKFRDDVTLKFQDDMTLKFQDDVITLKFRDDVTLKFRDDVTFKFQDDVTLKFQDDVTLKFRDDVTFKFQDDVTLKFQDDIGPGPKPLSDVKLAGADVGPEAPGVSMQQGGLSPAPFILATPHHSMAWAGTTAAQQESPPRSFEEVIPQYEATLASLEQAMQATWVALQQLDEQYRRLFAEYETVVEAYRSQTGEQPGS